MPRKSKSLVYSTDVGRRCPGCQRPIADCVCRSKPAAASDGIIRIQRETKGRKGKGVTTVSGVPAHEVQDLGKRLRKRLGTGGSVKGGVIEVQGEHVDALVEALTALGYDTRPRPK